MPASLAENLDLAKIRLIAVQDGGRLKTFDSLAREMIARLAHTEYFEGQDPVLTYLDLMLDPASYRDRNIIHIKKHAVRVRLTSALRNTLSAAELARIEKEGLVSPNFVGKLEVREVLREMEADVMRSANDVQEILVAWRACTGEPLRHRWRLIPPPEGGALDSWFDGDTLWGHGAPADSIHGGMSPTGHIPGLAQDKADALTGAWQKLDAAWKSGDATAANAALNEIASVVPTIRPDLYPSESRREIEHWYVGGKVLFWKNNKLTWVWVFYLIAFVFLLHAFVYNWTWARRIGMSVFVFSYALHSVGVGIRWYLQGRVPNANMFEAVTISVWWAAPVAFLLAILFRRHRSRDVYVLGASLVAMFALMAGNFLPVTLGSSMSVMMPVLDVIWLRIHTNLIVYSYAFIGIATVAASFTLIRRLLVRPTAALLFGTALPTMFFLVALFDKLGMTHAFSSNNPRLIGLVMSVTTPFALVFLPATFLWLVRLVFPAIANVRAPQLAGDAEAAAVSGARQSNRAKKRRKESEVGFETVLDGVTMILMQLSFLSLWVGLVLGAVWADVSWGRPWGWDPKEVFALNTFIVFLILVHVRLKVRDKPLWTALLCVTGCSVMLFNWIAINFVITGLHSYA